MNTNRQHMPSQQQQPTTEQIQKQREYLKQQQKLRLMAASSSQKIVTADTLIENLLGKKDTFKPLDNSVAAYPPGGMSGATSASQAPGEPRQPPAVEWLSPDAAIFPAVYRHVWSLVGQPNGMVDTKKIFSLLLSSGLHTDVLGYIWGLANQRVAGQLTEQELYVLLALVALAQKGYSFNSASVLSLVPQPPLPNLNLVVETPHTNGMQREDLSHPVSAPTVIPPRVETKPVTPAQLHSLQPTLMQTFTSHQVVEHNDFDDFTDFQSASANVPDTSLKQTASKINNAAEYQNSDLHSFEVFEPSRESSSKPSASTQLLSLSKPAAIPEPEFIQKCPSVSVLGGGGRSIGSRLANHSLGSSKANKSRLHKHHHHHRNATPSTNVVTEDDFSDFQQASASELFPRCQPTSKPAAMHTFLLKETAIRDESPVNVEPSPSKPVIFVEAPSTVTVVEQIPQVPKPPSRRLPQAESGGELMGTEDRYGALRALSFATDAPDDSSDDFGDFFSSQPTAANDSFAEIAARVNDPAVADTFAWGPTEPDTLTEQVEFQVDDWSSFASATPTHSDANSLTQSHSNTYLPSDANATSREGAASSQPITHQIGLGLDLDFGLGSLVKPPHSVVPSSRGACDDIQGLSFDLMDSTDICAAAPLSSVFVGGNETEEDDFGDFVGPEIVLEVAPSVIVPGEINLRPDVNAMTIDAGPRLDEAREEVSKVDVGKTYHGATAENHLVTGLWLEEAKNLDTQSVSSLELPGMEQVWDAVGEWRKCLRSCVTILQATADTLQAVHDPAVMAEVLRASRTREHLRDIVEVWAVTERLAASYRQSTTDSRIDALLSSVESAWHLLKPLLSQAGITIAPETATDGLELCGVCLAAGAQLVFDNRSYHASCANLWLNKVDSVLPALQLP